MLSIDKTMQVEIFCRKLDWFHVFGISILVHPRNLNKQYFRQFGESSLQFDFGFLALLAHPAHFRCWLNSLHEIEHQFQDVDLWLWLWSANDSLEKTPFSLVFFWRFISMLLIFFVDLLAYSFGFWYLQPESHNLSIARCFLFAFGALQNVLDLCGEWTRDWRILLKTVLRITKNFPLILEDSFRDTRLHGNLHTFVKFELLVHVVENERENLERILAAISFKFGDCLKDELNKILLKTIFY